MAFQEEGGPNVVGIDRLFYQAPFGDFTFTFGGRVGQEDMSHSQLSLYPASMFGCSPWQGAPGAFNKNLGAGAGLWWQKNGWAISANGGCQWGELNPQDGGIATDGAAGTGTVQIDIRLSNGACGSDLLQHSERQ